MFADLVDSDSEDDSSPQSPESPNVTILMGCTINKLKTDNIDIYCNQHGEDTEVGMFGSTSSGSTLVSLSESPRYVSLDNKTNIDELSTGHRPLSAPARHSDVIYQHQSSALASPALARELLPTKRGKDSQEASQNSVARSALGKQLSPAKRPKPSGNSDIPGSSKERVILEKQKGSERFEVVDHTVGATSPTSGSAASCKEKPKTLTLHEKIIVDLTDRVCEGSKIFRGKHYGRDGEAVAVKIITSFSKENEDEIESLKSASKHENVVDYYSCGSCNYGCKKAMYIVMELCDVETLEKKLKSLPEKRTFTEKLTEILQIAKGLHHLHASCKILHRDLKPGNILFKDGVCKITDFGLSKRMLPGKSNTTQNIEKIGTDGWRAPETSDCEADSTQSSDIYSLGLIFYYDLTDGVHSHGSDRKKRQSNILFDRNMCLGKCKSMPDGRIIENLLASMLSHKIAGRPDIESVLKHPTFWSVRKKLDFFGAIVRYEEFREEQSKQNRRTLRRGRVPSFIPPSLSEELDKRSGDLGKEVLKRGWFKALTLDEDERDKFQRDGIKPKANCIEEKATGKKNKSNYDGRSVFSCVKFVRNRDIHHFQDRVHVDFVMTEEQFWEFFSKRYPYLFIYTFTIVKTSLRGKSADPHLKEIFEIYF